MTPDRIAGYAAVAFIVLLSLICGLLASNEVPDWWHARQYAQREG